MVIVINQFIYILFTVWMVAIHAKKIEQHRKIRHGWWGLLAVGVAGLFWFINPWLMPVQIMWRAVLFSPLLNLARQLPLSYTSPTSTSIIDKIERKIFKKFWIRMVVYAALLIILEIILWQNYLSQIETTTITG